MSMEPAKPPALVTATPYIKKGPDSLKKLAAKSLVHAFDPYDKDNKNSVAMLKNSAEIAVLLPEELQDEIKQVLVEKKIEVLEQINDVQPIQLSLHEIWPNFATSPDSSYLCSLVAETYSAPFPHAKPINMLSLVHIPTKEETLIEHPNLVHLHAPYWYITSEILFTEDSTAVIFREAVPADNTAVYQYHISTKTKSPLAHIPLPDASLQYIISAMKKLVVGFNTHERNETGKTGIMDIELNSFVLVKGNHPVISPSKDYIITHESPEKQAYCFDLQGNLRFQLPHDFACASLVACNNDGSQIATALSDTITLWNNANGQAIKTITYPNAASLYNLFFAPDGQQLGCLAIFGQGAGIPSQVVYTDLLTNEYTLVSNEPREKVKFFMTQHPSMNRWVGPAEACAAYVTLSPGMYKVSPDARAIIAISKPPQKGYPYWYATHRAITDTAPLSEILKLLIAEKQRHNNQPPDTSIIESLLETSSPPRLREIVQKRYNCG